MYNGFHVTARRAHTKVKLKLGAAVATDGDANSCDGAIIIDAGPQVELRVEPKFACDVLPTTFVTFFPNVDPVTEAL